MEIKYFDEKGQILEDLFSEKAKEIVDLIFKPTNADKDRRGKVKKKLSYSQIRKFYDEVLNFKAMLDNGKSFREILPYFKMLKAKANVSFERDVINSNFKEFIDKNVDYVTEPKNIEEKEKRFNVFVTFFEAVVAYSKGKEK